MYYIFPYACQTLIKIPPIIFNKTYTYVSARGCLMCMLKNVFPLHIKFSFVLSPSSSSSYFRCFEQKKKRGRSFSLFLPFQFSKEVESLLFIKIICSMYVCILTDVEYQNMYVVIQVCYSFLMVFDKF